MYKRYDMHPFSRWLILLAVLACFLPVSAIASAEEVKYVTHPDSRPKSQQEVFTEYTTFDPEGKRYQFLTLLDSQTLRVTFKDNLEIAQCEGGTAPDFRDNFVVSKNTNTYLPSRAEAVLTGPTDDKRAFFTYVELEFNEDLDNTYELAYRIQKDGGGYTDNALAFPDAGTLVAPFEKEPLPKLFRLNINITGTNSREYLNFNENTNSYSLTTESESVTITATSPTKEPVALSFGGTSSNGPDLAVNLQYGVNVVTISVGDAGSVETYTLTITRTTGAPAEPEPAEPNFRLEKVAVEYVGGTEKYDVDIPESYYYAYLGRVTAPTESIRITPVLAGETAGVTVKVDGVLLAPQGSVEIQSPAPGRDRPVDVELSSPSGETLSYRLEFGREIKPYLTGLELWYRPEDAFRAWYSEFKVDFSREFNPNAPPNTDGVYRYAVKEDSYTQEQTASGKFHITVKMPPEMEIVSYLLQGEVIQGAQMGADTSPAFAYNMLKADSGGNIATVLVRSTASGETVSYDILLEPPVSAVEPLMKHLYLSESNIKMELTPQPMFGLYDIASIGDKRSFTATTKKADSVFITMDATFIASESTKITTSFECITNYYEAERGYHYLNANIPFSGYGETKSFYIVAEDMLTGASNRYDFSITQKYIQPEALVVGVNWDQIDAIEKERGKIDYRTIRVGNNGSLCYKYEYGEYYTGDGPWQVPPVYDGGWQPVPYMIIPREASPPMDFYIERESGMVWDMTPPEVMATSGFFSVMPKESRPYGDEYFSFDNEGYRFHPVQVSASVSVVRGLATIATSLTNQVNISYKKMPSGWPQVINVKTITKVQPEPVIIYDKEKRLPRLPGRYKLALPPYNNNSEWKQAAYAIFPGQSLKIPIIDEIATYNDYKNKLSNEVKATYPWVFIVSETRMPAQDLEKVIGDSGIGVDLGPEQIDYSHMPMEYQIKYWNNPPGGGSYEDVGLVTLNQQTGEITVAEDADQKMGLNFVTMSLQARVKGSDHYWSDARIILYLNKDALRSTTSSERMPAHVGVVPCAVTYVNTKEYGGAMGDFVKRTHGITLEDTKGRFDVMWGNVKKYWRPNENYEPKWVGENYLWLAAKVGGFIAELLYWMANGGSSLTGHLEDTSVLEAYIKLANSVSNDIGWTVTYKGAEYMITKAKYDMRADIKLQYEYGAEIVNDMPLLDMIGLGGNEEARRMAEAVVASGKADIRGRTYPVRKPAVVAKLDSIAKFGEETTTQMTDLRANLTVRTYYTGINNLEGLTNLYNRFVGKKAEGEPVRTAARGVSLQSDPVIDFGMPLSKATEIEVSEDLVMYASHLGEFSMGVDLNSFVSGDAASGRGSEPGGMPVGSQIEWVVPVIMGAESVEVTDVDGNEIDSLYMKYEDTLLYGANDAASQDNRSNAVNPSRRASSDESCFVVKFQAPHNALDKVEVQNINVKFVGDDNIYALEYPGNGPNGKMNFDTRDRTELLAAIQAVTGEGGGGSGCSSTSGGSCWALLLCAAAWWKLRPKQR